jgi:hypothetical protein
MRAPSERLLALGEPQWQAIRGSLASLIDADAVMACYRWWDVTSTPQRPLRAVLAEMFEGFVTEIPPEGRPRSHWTPKKAARQRRATLASVETTLDRLRALRWQGAAAAESALTALAAELHADPDETATVYGNSNARKQYRNEYLDHLVRLWEAFIVPAAGRRPLRKELERFLLACAEPLFPSITAKAVANLPRPQTSNERLGQSSFEVKKFSLLSASPTIWRSN